MKHLILFSILMISLTANASVMKLGPMKVGKGDSGTRGPRYSIMIRDITNLEKKYKNFATKIYIGISEKGTDIYGILLRKKDTPRKNLIFISGVTHGNEYLGIANNLAKEFLKDNESEFYSYMERGGSILIVPIINPDGYKKRTRNNSNRKDLNRDFSNAITGITRFTQSETKDLSNWIKEYINEYNLDFKVALDYHCCYSGSLLFPWAYTTDTPLPGPDRNEFNEMGELLRTQFPIAKYGETSEIMWYAADGTSMDYWYGEYGALGMTYEGSYRTEKDQLSKHVNWWSKIVQKF